MRDFRHLIDVNEWISYERLKKSSIRNKLLVHIHQKKKIAPKSQQKLRV